MVKEALPDLTHARRNLGEPDDGFHGFDLAEKGSDTAELMVTPMLKQARSLRRHLPLVRVRDVSPLVNELAHLIDNRRVVLLLLS